MLAQVNIEDFIKYMNFNSKIIITIKFSNKMHLFTKAYHLKKMKLRLSGFNDAVIYAPPFRNEMV